MNKSTASRKPYSEAQLEAVGSGVEQGICDTVAWQDMVRRVGLKEARRILRLGVLSAQDIPGNPKN